MDQSFDKFTGLAVETLGSKGWLGMRDEASGAAESCFLSSSVKKHDS